MNASCLNLVDRFRRSNRLFEMRLSDAAVTAVLSVQLWENTPTFPDSVETGTFTIGAADAQFDTCGLCVLIFTQFNVGDLSYGQIYLAKSGTVTLTEVDEHMVGTLTDVTLQHVEIDALTLHSTVQEDGCTTAIHGDFDVAMPEIDCGDGIDNDQDGATDCEDDDCLADTGNGC